MNGDRHARIRELTIPQAAAGERLDRWLPLALGDISRARLQALIEEGAVEADARPVKAPSRKLKAGEIITIRLPPLKEALPQPQAIPLNVNYEDASLIVVDKPPGLVVHPAAGNPDGTLVNALLAHCGSTLSGIGGVLRPGIVHRIDKDTSGLIVAAKSDLAHAGLAAQFAEHKIERSYLAVLRGVPRPEKGTIEGAIGRSTANRKKMAVVKQGGKAAVTHYRVKERFGEIASLAECRLQTGRTHQIRVHMTHIGHPLIGDPLYGKGRSALPNSVSEEAADVLKTFPRQALHAATLGFAHPETGETLRFSSELPADMAALIEILRRM